MQFLVTLHHFLDHFFFFIYPIGNVLQIIQTHLVIVAGFLGLGGGGGTYTLLLVV